MKKYDFSGYATRNDLRCSDGRTITKDAFKDKLAIEHLDNTIFVYTPK